MIKSNDLKEKLKKSRKVATITLAMLLMLLTGLVTNKYLYSTRYNNKIGVSSVVVKNYTSNNTNNISNENGTISGYDEIGYTIKYKLETEDKQNVKGRDVIVEATLSDEDAKYATWKLISDESIKSEIINSGKTLKLTIDNITTNTEYEVMTTLTVTGAPDKFTVSPKVEVKEATSENSTIVNANVEKVSTRSITGKVINKQNSDEVKSIELQLFKIDEGNYDDKRITYTKEDGSYSFSDLKNGIYQIKLADENKYALLNEIQEITINDNSEVLNIEIANQTKFRASIKKYVKQVIVTENGKEKTYDFDKIDKALVAVKNMSNASIKIIYEFDIKNETNKSGFVKVIKENIPKGLVFYSDYSENAGWEEIDGKLYNKTLANTEIKPNETKTLKIALKTENTSVAKSYLNKVSITGENYYTVKYIIDDEVVKELSVIDSDKITYYDYEKNNSKLTGWYTDKEYKNEYDFNSVVEDDLVLYGKLKDTKKYCNFTYLRRDGTIFKETTIECGSKAEDIEGPTDEYGYDFKCWSDAVNNENECFDFDIPVKEDTTVTSNMEKHIFNVTFIDQGKQYGEVQKIKYQEKATKPEDPSKDKSEFLGWTLDGKIYDFDTLVEKDITLVSSYRNKNDVIFVDELLKENNHIYGTIFDVKYGANITKPDSDPIHEGYTFIGWYESNSDIAFNFETSTMPNNNLMLYAHYKINTNKVEFKDTPENCITEDCKFEDIPDMDVPYDTTIDEPTKKPEKECLEFKYWSIYETGLDDDGNEAPFNFLTTKIKKNTTLYAIYDEKEVSITYIDQGKVIESDDKTNKISCGSKILTDSICEKEGNCDKPGYQFECFRDAENPDVCLPDDSKITKNMTLVTSYIKLPSPIILHTPTYWTNLSNENLSVTMSLPTDSTITKSISKKVVEENGLISYTEEEYETQEPLVLTEDKYDIEYQLVNEKDYDDESINFEGYELSKKWTKYTESFNQDKNVLVVGKIVVKDTNEESEILTHPITNIDKKAPKVSSNSTSASTAITISGTVEDNQSLPSKIEIYYVKGQDVDIKQFLDDESKSDFVNINTYTFNDEKAVQNYSGVIEELEEDTIYSVGIIAYDLAGNKTDMITSNISTTSNNKKIVAEIIGRNNVLYESEESYESFESLEQAVNACGDKQCTIRMVDNTTESVVLQSTQNITLDLNGKIVSGTDTNTIENLGEFIVLDNGEDAGSIKNENTDSIAISNNGTITLGINDDKEPSKERPNIIGTLYGIKNDENGIFNFYDGRIEAFNAIYGTPTSYPENYSATIDTETSVQVATLNISADAEARIGSKKFVKLEDAIEASAQGEYIEQEEVVNVLATAQNYDDEEYGFEYDELTKTLSSNVSGNQGEIARTYIEFDLTNKTENMKVKINLSDVSENSISSETYIFVTDNTDKVQKDSSAIIKKYFTANTSNTHTITLTAGSKYYIHFYYRVKTNKESKLTINSVSFADEGSDEFTDTISHISKIPKMNDNPDIIVLLRDIKFDGDIQISNIKNVILDLDGKNISNVSIINNGKLQIINRDVNNIGEISSSTTYLVRNRDGASLSLSNLKLIQEKNNSYVIYNSGEIDYINDVSMTLNNTDVKGIFNSDIGTTNEIGTLSIEALKSNCVGVENYNSSDMTFKDLTISNADFKSDAPSNIIFENPDIEEGTIRMNNPSSTLSISDGNVADIKIYGNSIIQNVILSSISAEGTGNTEIIDSTIKEGISNNDNNGIMNITKTAINGIDEYIFNKGNMTIADSNVNGNYIINNTGNITISNSTISKYRSTSYNNISNSGIFNINNCTIKNFYISNARNGEFNIELCSIENTTTSSAINNSSNMNINGSNIKANVPISNSSGVMNISGNTIIESYSSNNEKNKTYAITNWCDSTNNICGEDLPIVNINGNLQIKSKFWGGIWNVGILNIGTSDNIVSNEFPIIEGSEYGVYNDETFNYYTGKIIGKSGKSIYGTINEYPNNYTVNREIVNKKEEATLVSTLKVARIGDIEYETLKKAFDSITEENGRTKIELLTNVDQFENLIVSEKQNIVLDLNGYTINLSIDDTITNNGTLEITDSTNLYVEDVIVDGAGSITSKLEYNFVTNNNEIILNKVKIENSKMTNNSHMQTTYCTFENIVNNADDKDIVNNADAILDIMTGSNLKSNIGNKGTINMSDGTVLTINNDQNFNMSGGNLKTLNNSTNAITKVTNDSIIVNLVKNFGTLEALSGRFENGITNTKNGIVTLGSKDGIVETNMPYVTSSGTPITNEGILNYYDGTIEKRNLHDVIGGYTNLIYNKDDNDGSAKLYLEDDTIIKYNENIDESDTYVEKVCFTLGESEDLVEVENVGTYKTINEAIQNITTDNLTTLKFLRFNYRPTDDEIVVIPNGKNIKLDLNGNFVESVQEKFIENNGNLTILNSQDNSAVSTKIELCGDNRILIENNAVLSLESLLYTRSKIVNNGDLYVRNNANVMSNIYNNQTGKAILEDGVVNSIDENMGYVELPKESTSELNYIINKGNLEMRGGTINCLSKINIDYKFIASNLHGNYNIGIINYSNVAIYGGKISNESIVDVIGIINLTGNINMQNGSISVVDYKYSILAIGGSVNILGGNIKGKIYGGNKITLGEEGGEVSIKTPSIIGEIDNGFKFYDGVINTTSNVIPSIVENGYLVKKDGNLNYLDRIDIAKINDDMYKSLQEAINNSNDGDTITIIDDFNIYSSFKTIDVPSDKNITIDLNGHTITPYNGTFLTNNGTLNLKDSTFSVTLTNGATNIYIINNGILNMFDVNYNLYNKSIINNNILTINSGIFNNATIESKKELNINGGEFSIINSNGVTNINNDAKISTLTVEDGVTNINDNAKITKITAHGDTTINGNCQIDDIYSIGKIVIENGTIKEASLHGLVYINGGEFNNIAVNSETTFSDESTRNYITEATINGLLNLSFGEINISNSTINEIHSLGTTTLSHQPGYRYISDSNIGNISVEGDYFVTLDLNTKVSGSIVNKSTLYVKNTVSIDNNDGVGISNSGKLYIGEDDEFVSKTNPEITGSTYGLINTGTVYFYDGIITGNSGNAISDSGEIICPDNYEIYLKTIDTSSSAILTMRGTTVSVVEFNNQSFSSLEAAIEAAPENEPVVMHLLSDIILYSNIVSNGKDITLVKGEYNIYMGDYTISDDIKIYVSEPSMTNVLATIMDIFSKNNISKNIIVYEMDDGNKLDVINKYELLVYNEGVYEKIYVENDNDNVGRYSISNKTNDNIMTTINGRLYLNNLSVGNYKIIDNNKNEILFSIENDGSLTGNIKENYTNNFNRIMSTSQAQLIINIQTGQKIKRYGIVIAVLTLLLLVFMYIKNKTKKVA